MSNVLSKRPYLLRAMHQWIMDCGDIPHVIVDAECGGTEVPEPYVQDGTIVLNISYSATQQLKLGNEELEFDARFGSVSHHVRVPVGAVMEIYARGSGEGMVLSEEDLGPEPPESPDASEEGTRSGSAKSRPKLKVVK
jgi:stringent starvation protein B